MPNLSALDTLRDLERRAAALQAAAARAQTIVDKATERAAIAAAAVYAAVGKSGKPKSVSEAMAVADAELESLEAELIRLTADAEAKCIEAETLMAGDTSGDES